MLYTYIIRLARLSNFDFLFRHAKIIPVRDRKVFDKCYCHDTF